MPEKRPETQPRPKGRHSVVMQDCMKLSLSGVTDADSFDEGQIRLFTECGELTVYGADLHVNEMNVDTGSVTIEGEVRALVYGDRSAKKRLGVLGRLLR
ncbi:sporulation protein YabP [Ruminococcus sp. YE71]|uniref:YabP/YqfC family sporulation protein n=1 Tax=unclassified Ruminococcus TaxID=2608920 RepID=UPI0008854948|nr:MULTISPECIES: YabP/YqfC family sporulation protein [unclassified Ruminococcus]SDA15352.1 sporulation protein YabP [Ruminococcus sp. YE78]SFW22396.1 sporulation protein YabP [Ruminococcus sp. YE71]